jgi:Inner membrane component of T3SS, cytoplasmic domain
VAGVRELFLIDAEGRELSLTEQPIRIGSAAECEVRLDGAAAPVHVRVSREKVEAMAECFLGSVLLEPGHSRSLAGACTLRIGGVELRIEEEWDVGSASTRRLAFELVKLAAVPEIVVVEGAEGDVGRTLGLAEPRDYLIGRASTCDLALDDIAMSREHLVVRGTAEHVMVRDRGTTRGTFLGSTRLDADRKAVWPAEHMIRIGRTVLALRLPDRQEALLARAMEAPPTAAAVPAPPAGDASPQADRGEMAPASAVESSERKAPIASVPEPREKAGAVRPPPLPRGRSALASAGIVVLVLVALATAGMLLYVLVA